jgi:hypothetical protein
MNERIKELVEQAKTYAADSTKDYTGDEPIGFMDYYTEKFAELIVQDCMTMSDELKAQYLKSRRFTTDFAEKNIYAGCETACDIIKYKMKRQFGVDE